MNDETAFVEQREQLLDSIERGEEDLRQAVQELTDVARDQFTLGELIKSSPLPWLLGGLVIGFWFGCYRR